jgi:hypothetical protein
MGEAAYTVSPDLTLDQLLARYPRVFIGTVTGTESVFEPEPSVGSAPFPTLSVRSTVQPTPTDKTPFPENAVLPYSYVHIVVEASFSPDVAAGSTVSVFQAGGDVLSDDGMTNRYFAEEDPIPSQGKRYLFFARVPGFNANVVESPPWGKFPIVQGIVSSPGDWWEPILVVKTLMNQPEASLAELLSVAPSTRDATVVTGGVQ